MQAIYLLKAAMGPWQIILNQLEKLEAAKTAYLRFPLVTFPYLWLPFLTFGYLSLLLVNFPYRSLTLVTFGYIWLVTFPHLSLSSIRDILFAIIRSIFYGLRWENGL